MQKIRTFRTLHSFWKNDAGLATLEWIALASTVIVLGLGVIILLQPKTTTAASTVGSNLVSSVNSNS